MAIDSGDTDPNDTVDLSIEWTSFSKDTFDGLGCPGLLACLTITTSTLPAVSQGQVYNETVVATGATNYTYTMTGNNGSGLTIDAVTGVISGVVIANTDINLTVTATDADDTSRTVSQTLTIS